MKIALFLLVAIAIGAGLGFGGALLMPRLGIGGMPARAIPGAFAGALIAILYLRMFKRPSGA